MIKPIDLLTENDMLNINQYISTYGGSGGYSMECRTAELPYILRFWNQEKINLLQLFGNQLIIEKEIDIEYPRSLLVEEMEERLYSPRLTFVNEYWRWLDNSRLYQTDYLLYSELSALMGHDYLCDNVYNRKRFPNEPEHLSIPVEGGRPIDLHNGCKVMKILAKIAKAFNIDGFEEFRIAHSMVLNKKRFKGTLCVSIHPLDYMTMSDNYCDWDSCMSWQKPGEYREGTVETMNSRNIIVAYLKASEDMHLWGGSNAPKWNNKRWRELFIVQQDCMSGIRGYPYNDNILENAVYDMLRELMLANKPEYAWETEPSFITSGETCALANGTPIRVHIEHHIMYDDYGCNQKFFPGPSIYPQLEWDKRYNICISGATECMCCGSDWSDRWDSFNEEYVMCPECAGEYTCHECGEYITPEDTAYFADDEELIVCRYCAERLGDVCESCNDWHHNHNIHHIYMRHLDVVDESCTVRLCNWCMENGEFTDDLGPIEYKPISSKYYGNRYQVDTRNFTRRGFTMFGIFGDVKIGKMKAEIAEAAGEPAPEIPTVDFEYF